MPITRREALTASLSLALTPLATANALIQDPSQPKPLPTDLVRDFVGAAHVDFDKLKSMLIENPTLLNATYDWKNGDFESAIGAAGHMGRRDIAEFLIEKGARTDLFVHAMLGDINIVKPILTAYPQLVNSKGPHGITLLRHAEKGEDKAKEVLDYIKTIQKLI